MGFYLDYPITRPYPSKWFGPLSLALAAAAIVILTVVNVALAGYETVAVFEVDFHAKDTHWYDSFLPSRKNKQRCDPAVYKMGDVFRTNTSFFEWRIESITDANAATGLAYRGSTLESCDPSSLFIDATLQTVTVAVTVLIVCRVENVAVNARTSFSVSALPGKYDSLVGDFFNVASVTPRLAALQAVASGALDISSVVVATLNSSGPSVIGLSTQLAFSYCPANSSPDTPCLAETPTFTYERTSIMTTTNVTQGFDNTTGKLNLGIYTPAVDNLAQIVHAAVRIDIGNNRSKNILLDPSLVDNTLHTTFPSFNGFTPSLIEYFRDPTSSGTEYSGSIPLSSNFGSSYIPSSYLCHFQRIKEPGNFFIAVLVATLSMFSSGWAVYTGLAMIWWKRKNPIANKCDGHGYDAICPSSSDSSSRLIKDAV